MLINRAKLIKALKERRARIVLNHTKRTKGFAKEIAIYRKRALVNLKNLETEIRKAKTCLEIKELGYEANICNRDYPKPPHKVPATAGVDKALIELELMDESVLTIEMDKNYLSILRGEEDRTKEYDDDEDDEE